MVNAAFAVVIGNLLIASPGAVIPTWGALVVAVLVGQAMYRYRMNLVWVSIIGVAALYGLIIIGDMVPIVLPARFVGDFGAVGEGLLALGAIIATTAGLQTMAEWESIYSQFAASGVNAFVQGGGAILHAGLAIPESPSATILATMTVLFAATTMNTGVRLQRFVVQEAAELAGIKFGTDKFFSSIFVLLAGLGLAFGAGANGSGGMIVWPLFATTNPLMAALTLAILAVILVRNRRSIVPIMVPMVFISIMTLYALLVQLGSLYRSGTGCCWCAGHHHPDCRGMGHDCHQQGAPGRGCRRLKPSSWWSS